MNVNTSKMINLFQPMFFYRLAVDDPFVHDLLSEAALVGIGAVMELRGFFVDQANVFGINLFSLVQEDNEILVVALLHSDAVIESYLIEGLGLADVLEQVVFCRAGIIQVAIPG